MTNKFPKFDGENTDVRIQTWIKLYELHTEGSTDKDRINKLMFVLLGKALEWFGSDIAGHPTIKLWETVKVKMIKRFGCQKGNALIQAQKIRLRRDQSVEEYYREKIYYLKQTKLSEEDIICQLTEGLPVNWQISFASQKFADTTDWIEAVTNLEQIHSSVRRSQQQHKKETPTNSCAAASEKKPSKPCRFCLNKNKTAYHRHSECALNPKSKAKKPDKKPKKLMVDSSSSEDEPDPKPTKEPETATMLN